MRAFSAEEECERLFVAGMFFPPVWVVLWLRGMQARGKEEFASVAPWIGRSLSGLVVWLCVAGLVYKVSTSPYESHVNARSGR